MYIKSIKITLIGGNMGVVTLIITILLFFILFFGFGMMLNMFFKRFWIMSIVYPFIALFFIADFSIMIYFKDPLSALEEILSLYTADVFILLSGMFGALAAGLVTKKLRSSGYTMF